MSQRLAGCAAAAAVIAAVALPGTALAARCDGVPTKGCLLPFPNDATQTKADKRTPTGRRVALTSDELPVNKDGAKTNPAEWNRNDGFSPGQPIIVHVPSLHSQASFSKSGIVPVYDLARFKAGDQPLLLLDERTGKRQIVWGELDANADSPATANLIIHPAKNLSPGGRYAVVLRNLPDRAPKGLWDTVSPALGKALDKAGVARKSVYLVWDFSVASDKSLTSRLLAMRDDAFAQLGDRNLADGVIEGAPPGYTITSVQDFTPAQDAQIARWISGT